MRTRVGLIAAGLAVAGCSGGSGTPRLLASPLPSVSSTATAPAVTPTATRTGVLPTRSGTPKPTVSPVSPTADFGYFPAIVAKGPPVKLSFDRAYFLTGDAANKAAAARGDESPVPNDYYIVNDNKLQRPVTLAADVNVVGSLQLNGYAGHAVVEPQPRTVGELLGFLARPEGKSTGFHLTYGAAGKVVRVEEQYQP